MISPDVKILPSRLTYRVKTRCASRSCYFPLGRRPLLSDLQTRDAARADGRYRGRTGVDGSVPASISAKEVARRVIELYWPQTVPYGTPPGGEPRMLSQAAHNDIPSKLASWRQLPPLGSARQPGGGALRRSSWRAALESDLTAVVIGMPLAKLQRFGERQRSIEERFIYDFSWRDEVGRSTVARADFDDALRLQQGRRVAGQACPSHPPARPGEMDIDGRCAQYRPGRFGEADRIPLRREAHQPGTCTRPSGRGAGWKVLLLRQPAGEKLGY